MNHALNQLLEFGDKAANPAALKALKRFVLEGRLTNYLENLIASQNNLATVAAMSYPHPNGFDKIVLAEAASGARIRLHLWWPGSVERSDIHDHFWDFASVVIYGKLISETYSLVGRGEKIITRHFHLDPRPKGDHSLQFVEERKLVCVERKFLDTGAEQILGHTQLHRITCPENISAATLVLLSPKRWNENNVFLTTNEPENDQEVHVEHFSAEELKIKLKRALDFLNSNNSFIKQKSFHTELLK